jgi:Na+/H+ antiporter NhaD/arsenite permease-like protein
VAAVVIMWVSAVASAAVDNIPFTMAMIPVIQNLESLGVPVNILWWSLALGVGFGGNGTPIGSTANVVVVAKSEQTDDPITFARWFKSGSIVMLLTCIVATIAIILLPEWLSGPHR